jgi:hypothetical protein
VTDVRLELFVLGAGGHTVVSWDPDKPDEVDKARAEFERLKAAGFMLFVVDTIESTDFPAEAGRLMAELVAAPPETPAEAPLTGALTPKPKKPKYVKGSEQQAKEFNPKKSTVAVRRMGGGACPA